MSDSTPTPTWARVASYAVSNIGTVAAIYYGANGVEWAARVAVFIIWLGAVTALLLNVALNDKTNKGDVVMNGLKRRRPLTLHSFDGYVDLAYCFVFVALGWTWTAIGAGLMTICGEGSRSIYRDRVKNG